MFTRNLLCLYLAAAAALAVVPTLVTACGGGREDCLQIYSGVHVECTDGTLDCITWIEQKAGFKYIHLRAGSEGTVGGCKPGSGSRGHWKFAEVPGLGFTASTQGNLRWNGGGAWTLRENRVFGPDTLRLACIESLPSRW
ncbi:unnamed protein product [Jaminaea pallidilutea]